MFYDVNFKILHRILATPAIVAKIKGSKSLQKCQWCDGIANIDHILVHCIVTNTIYEGIGKKLGIEIPIKNCILGSDANMNPVFWVINFTIYKAHTQWCEGIPNILEKIVQQECTHYKALFPILSKLS